MPIFGMRKRKKPREGRRPPDADSWGLLLSPPPPPSFMAQFCGQVIYPRGREGGALSALSIGRIGHFPPYLFLS